MVPDKTPPIIQNIAAQLRHNQTNAEEILWSHLRSHQLNGVHVRRQHPIGKYIADFCVVRKKLIIEIDGSPHRNNIELDMERTAYFNTRGYNVIRFWNGEILIDIDTVIEKIRITLRDR